MCKGRDCRFARNTVDKLIEKCKTKLESLTNMRIENEISKEENQEHRTKLNADIYQYEQELYSIKKTKGSKRSGELTFEQFLEYFNQKIDFSGVKVDDKVIDKFVYKVIPENKDEFKWYMRFLPKSDDLKKYQEIITFTIPFKKASAYRVERGGYLRPTQYNDLIVHVYM